jgi:hypothetical protein
MLLLGQKAVHGNEKEAGGFQVKKAGIHAQTKAGRCEARGRSCARIAAGCR